MPPYIASMASEGKSSIINLIPKSRSKKLKFKNFQLDRSTGMSTRALNRPGRAHALTNSIIAEKESDGRLLESNTSADYKFFRAVPWWTRYLIEWKSPEIQKSDFEFCRAIDDIPKAFDPEQALQDHANGAFLNHATLSTELLRSSPNSDPLQGLPSRFIVDGDPVDFGPNLTIRRASETYCRLAGIPTKFPRV